MKISIDFVVQVSLCPASYIQKNPKKYAARCAQIRAIAKKHGVCILPIREHWSKQFGFILACKTSDKAQQVIADYQAVELCAFEPTRLIAKEPKQRAFLGFREKNTCAELFFIARELEAI